MHRGLCVNYCDDIRFEVGNKTSLIGVYGRDLVLPEVPATIPKLCVFVQIQDDGGKRFDGVLRLKLLLDDQVLVDDIVPTTRSDEPVKEDVFQRWIAQLILSPFVVPKECKLRVRVYFDDQEFKGGALIIRVGEGSARMNPSTSASVGKPPLQP